MQVPEIKASQLPPDLQSQVRDDEVVHYFSYIAPTGGCASAQQAKQWLMVTSKRVVFEAMVKSGDGVLDNFRQQNGSIPLAKVSYVGTMSESTPNGCGGAAASETLRINSSGGHISMILPTKDEVMRAQKVIDILISR